MASLDMTKSRRQRVRTQLLLGLIGIPSVLVNHHAYTAAASSKSVAVPTRIGALATVRT